MSRNVWLIRDAFKVYDAGVFQVSICVHTADNFEELYKCWSEQSNRFFSFVWFKCKYSHEDQLSYICLKYWFNSWLKIRKKTFSLFLSPTPHCPAVFRILALFVVGGCFLYILKLHFGPEECDRTKMPYVDVDRVKVGIFWLFFPIWLKNRSYWQHESYRAVQQRTRMLKLSVEQKYILLYFMP